jgi:hypothetical protein
MARSAVGRYRHARPRIGVREIGIAGIALREKGATESRTPNRIDDPTTVVLRLDGGIDVTIS